MRTKLYPFALVAIASMALLGCTIGDTPTIITVDQNQSQGNTGTTASPSPGAPGIVSVRVSTFGDETCPSASPANEANSVRVTCSQPVTCTPLLAGDVQAPPGAHPAAPDSFEVVSGGASGELRAASNPYNADLVGLSPGTVRLRCIVGGIGGDLDVAVLP